MSESVQFPIGAADGHVVQGTLRRGNGRGACLLVHGITADRHEWGLFDHLSDALSERSISTLAIDYRGHGTSLLPISSLSLPGVYLDIAAAWAGLLKETGEQSGNRTIIGNSFGGGLAYLFGQLTDSVDAVVMTCPVTNYMADLNRVNPDWMFSAPSGEIGYASKRLAADIVGDLCAFDDLISKIPARVSIDVVHGTEDADVPFSEANAFVDRLKPMATMHALAGMDHSFSAPEGVADRDRLSAEYRQHAALVIAELVGSR
jgi:dipeptidyl aminopeptidase/acylaminoacyl peptidase